MKQAQLISIVVYAVIAWWYVAPFLKRLQFGHALTVLLLVHVSRYIVLYLHVAQREGYAISDVAANHLITGDLIGAALAAAAIAALRYNFRVGLVICWILIVATIGDVANGFYQRSIDAPRADATGVFWMIFAFHAPAVLISLPLMAWQLVTRRKEPLKSVTASTERLAPSN